MRSRTDQVKPLDLAPGGKSGLMFQLSVPKYRMVGRNLASPSSGSSRVRPPPRPGRSLHRQSLRGDRREDLRSRLGASTSLRDPLVFKPSAVVTLTPTPAFRTMVIRADSITSSPARASSPRPTRTPRTGTRSASVRHPRSAQRRPARPGAGSGTRDRHPRELRAAESISRERRTCSSRAICSRTAPAATTRPAARST